VKPRKPRQTITTGQAARHLEVSVPTIRRWIRAGRLSGFTTAGHHARIGVAVFEDFLARHGMPPYRPSRAEVRILVVDDEPDVLDTVVELLAADPRGFKLETAVDGYEALIKVGIFKPTLLVLDAFMPQLDGVRVCRRIKAEPETRPVKILGITGYLDAIPSLIEAGADACLAKPLDVRQLRQQLDRLLPALEE
jgi:excisionase family DNA binding protein